MNIIILSASTGGGHMSAANSIKEFFISKNHNAKVVDALEYINPILNKTVTETYEYIATKQPKIWKLIYDSANKKTFNKLISGINSIISKKLIPLLEDFKPDAVISTHPFTTEMISNLKRSKIIEYPLICVMTDYAPHRTWTTPEVNAYIVANSDMISSMQDMDVDPKIIYPFGIPIGDSFHYKSDKKKVLQELSLNTNLPTILIMAGKGGLANIDKIYLQLQNINLDFQIIIITGKNSKLYNKMKNISQNKHKFKDKLKVATNKVSKYFPRIKRMKLKFKKIRNKQGQKLKETRVIYFTREVEKYMNASDLIITKPGGLTVSEALACNLPMALFNAIPGQEEENADFLVSNNMAIKLEKDACKKIENLLKNPSLLENMKSSCEKFDKSDSLKNIYNLICNLTSKEKFFNKLVRDKIPDIIEQTGGIPQIEILDSNLFEKYLKLKLIEESKEVDEATNYESQIEELADLLEVFYAILKNMNIDIQDVEKVRKAKEEKRGGFKNKIFLKKVIFQNPKD